MAGSLTPLGARRLRNTLLLLVFSGAALLAHLTYGVTLHRPDFVTGWLLFALMIALACYNMRKRLSFLPIGSSSAWLQFHIYAGLFTVVLFVIHVGLRFPNGRLELLVTALFAIVAGSGIIGIILSRTIPRYLAARGEEVLFERIPEMRRRLQQQVEDLVMRSAADSASTTIHDFYKEHLQRFFLGQRNFLAHIMGYQRVRHRLPQLIESWDRYFEEDERQVMHEIKELVCAKDDLDYQCALQALLKGWLFVHVPITQALLLFALLHGVLAHVYSGSVQ
ncbi:hypothetical protein JYT84_00365 [bacterium AH-315-M10]|nr:hypothetical protein [bacterium AH-315-M10]